MKFKPVTPRYDFHDHELLIDYPAYIQLPVASWIKELLYDLELIDSRTGIDLVFINDLQLQLRESYPSDPAKFISFVFQDADRTTNFLGLFLQNFATVDQAARLEFVLSKGGSAYAVSLTAKRPDQFKRGVADLVKRVPEQIVQTSQLALSSEPLLKEAWHACYSRNPDYDKTVSKCVDVLEGLLRDQYFVNDSKPELNRFIKDFQTNPNKLSYKGDTLLDPKNLLTDLAKKFIEVRGQHTKGTGKSASKEEAEFILGYSIFVWNVHRK